MHAIENDDDYNDNDDNDEDDDDDNDDNDNGDDFQKRTSTIDCIFIYNCYK